VAGRIDANRSGRDQVKCISGLSLPEDDRTCGVEQRLQVGRQLGEGYPLHAHEQIDLTQQSRVTDVVCLQGFGATFRRARGRGVRP
jgi:hypothetical protein